VKCYTLHAQILAKIVFHNLLPKSGEYSHARGCAPLLIYCLLKGIRINIPRLIIDVMLSEHLLISTRNLPYGMLLTRLFKHFKINLSNERVVNPLIDINSTPWKGCMLVLMFRLLPILPYPQSNILSLVPLLQLSILMKVYDPVEWPLPIDLFFHWEDSCKLGSYAKKATE